MLYDLIIIGGGTAGLTAALYAQRGGLKTLLLEGNVPGGQIVSSPELENYPALPKVSGVAFTQRLLEQACELGLDLKYEAAAQLDLSGSVKEIVTSSGNKYQAQTLIWTAGLNSRRLGCPGEDNFLGRGISFCAACDGMLYKNKEVAVVGGGNTALEEALFLSKICLRVHLLHRRDDFRAEAALQQRVQQTPNIVLRTPVQVQAFEGGKRLEQVVLQTAAGKEKLAVAAVFLAVGKVPANQLLASHLLPEELDEVGYINSAEDCLTSIPGVFVAGDCRYKPLRQLVTAAADGAVAASQAIAYLH